MTIDEEINRWIAHRATLLRMSPAWMKATIAILKLQAKRKATK